MVQYAAFTQSRELYHSQSLPGLMRGSLISAAAAEARGSVSCEEVSRALDGAATADRAGACAGIVTLSLLVARILLYASSSMRGAASSAPKGTFNWKADGVSSRT